MRPIQVPDLAASIRCNGCVEVTREGAQKSRSLVFVSVAALLTCSASAQQTNKGAASPYVGDPPRDWRRKEPRERTRLDFVVFIWRQIPTTGRSVSGYGCKPAARLRRGQSAANAADVLTGQIPPRRSWRGSARVRPRERTSP